MLILTQARLLSGSQQLRSYNLGLRTNWTLFDGLANLATLSRSKDELESAQLTLERLKQDIGLPDNDPLLSGGLQFTVTQCKKR